jgi:predicted RNA polymerase sigma factor
LALKTVCGFGTGEIARAFPIQETTPPSALCAPRRIARPRIAKGWGESVLETVYPMFNDGYASGGDRVLQSAREPARVDDRGDLYLLRDRETVR